MKKRCLYCNKEKSEDEFSQEHVIPRSVGGNLNTYNPFSINDVCGRCNNLSGLFIDAPFAKSWFINNKRAEVSKKYCNLSKDTVLPLVYFGEIEDLKIEDKICEFWLGPTGDTIYHFHQPYPEELDTPPMVGTPPTSYSKEIDFGFVFLFVRSNNPQWHPTIIFSVAANFKKSEIYLGNGDKPPVEQFHEIPTNLKELHDKLKSIQGKEHKNTFKVGIDFETRFLCKLALGLGAINLNESFKTSKSADLLRQFMWTRKRTDREKIPIRGTRMINARESISGLDSIFRWRGGHVLVLLSTREQLALYSNFYETNSSVIQISDEPEHWKGKIEEGIVYLVSPSLGKAIGPIRLPEYIGHIVEPPLIHEKIRELEEEMNRFGKLPPFDI